MFPVMSRIVRGSLLAPLLLASALALGVGSAAAKDLMRVSYETSDTHIKARTMAVFAAELKKLTPDIEVQMFSNSSLVPSKQEVTAAIRGQVEAIIPFTSYYEAVTPKVKVMTTPLAFKDYKAMDSAYEGKMGAAIRSDLDAKNLVALGLWFEPPTVLFTREKRPGSFADLRGMKIRTYPSETLERLIVAIGATPAVIPGSEVYLALQNKVVDGALSSFTFVESLKLTDHLKFMVGQPLIMGNYIFAVNKTFFQRLMPEQQQAVRKAAAIAAEWNRNELSRELTRTMSGSKELSVELVKPSPADEAEWSKAAAPLIQALDPDVRALLGGN
jgi:C4-dicarboxylate-binding protein DctP